MPRLVSIAGHDEVLRQGRRLKQRRINELFADEPEDQTSGEVRPTS